MWQLSGFDDIDFHRKITRIMKKIAIIGASALQNPLILKAKSMGLETHVFAWAAGDIGEKTADYFYPVSIVEKEQILSVCRKIGIHGICSIASDLAMLTVNYVADAMGLVGNSPECTQLSTNKASMREAFAKCGDPSPEFFVIRQGDDPNESAFREQITKLHFPVIVKPVDRSGSRGVTLVADKAELLPAIEHARIQGFSGDVIIESFVHGKEYSVECLSCRGVHTLLQITEKFTTGTPHFIETGHKEPALLPPEIRQKAEDIVLHALCSLKVTNGASHTEIRIDEDGTIMLIEVGARMGGDFIGSHLLPITCGFDYVKAVIDISLGEIVRPHVSYTGRQASVRYILTKEDLTEYERILREDPDSIVHSEIHSEVSTAVTDSSNRHGFWIRAYLL